MVCIAETYTSFQHTNTNHCNEYVFVQLKDQRFDHLYVSPLARARETADIIWEGRAPVKRHEPPVLREIDLYSFQAGPPAAGSRRAVLWHTLLGIAMLLVIPLAYLFCTCSQLQGLTKAEVKATFPAEYSDWHRRPDHFTIDGHAPVRWVRAQTG